MNPPIKSILDPASVQFFAEQANSEQWGPVIEWLYHAVEMDGGQEAILGMVPRIKDPASMVLVLGGDPEVVSQSRLCLAIRFACVAHASAEDFLSPLRRQQLGDQVRELSLRLFAAWRDQKSLSEDISVLDCFVTLDLSGLADVLGWLIDSFLTPHIGEVGLVRIQDALSRMAVPLVQRTDLLLRLLNVLRELESAAADRTTTLIKSFGLTCPKGLIDELLTRLRDPEPRGRLNAIDLVSTLAPDSFTEANVTTFIGFIRASDRRNLPAGLAALQSIADRLHQYPWAVPLVVGAFSSDSTPLSPSLYAVVSRFRDAAGPERTELIRLATQLSNGVKSLRESQQNPSAWSAYGCAHLDPILQALAKLGPKAADYPGVAEDISYLLLAWTTYPSNVDEAARTLGALSKCSVSTARVIPMLLKWLSSEQPHVGCNAAQALVAMRDLVAHYPGAMQRLRDHLSQPDAPGCLPSLEVWAGMIEHAVSEPGMVELLVPCVSSASKGLSQLAVAVLSDCADRGNRSEWVRELLSGLLRNPTWHANPVTWSGKGVSANPRAEASLRVAGWALAAIESPMAREDLLRGLACPSASRQLVARLCLPGLGIRVRSWAADEIVKWLRSLDSTFHENYLYLIAKLDLSSARNVTLAWVSDQLGIFDTSSSDRLRRIHHELVRRELIPSAVPPTLASKISHGPVPRNSTMSHAQTQGDPLLTDNPIKSFNPNPWRHRPGREFARRLFAMAKVDSPVGLLGLYLEGEPSSEEMKAICERVRFVFLDGTHAVSEDHSEQSIQIVAYWVWIYQRLIPDEDPGYQNLAFHLIVWGIFYRFGFVYSWPALLLLLSDLKGAPPSERYKFVEGMMTHVERSWTFYDQNDRKRICRLLSWPIVPARSMNRPMGGEPRVD